MGLGEGTTKGGEILREEEDAATVDSSVTSDNTIASDLFCQLESNMKGEINNWYVFYPAECAFEDR